MTRADDALRFPIAGLLADPPGSGRDLRVGPVALDLGAEGPTLAEPVDGDLHIARTNRGVIVRATVRTSLATACSRCLRPITVPLEAGIEEEALPSLDLATGSTLDRTAEPDVTRLTDHHELDLEPLVADAIRMAEPIAPLCRPDCPGLCPVCGADLSVPGHESHDEEIDPRMEALRGFRVDGEAETD